MNLICRSLLFYIIGASLLSCHNRLPPPYSESVYKITEQVSGKYEIHLDTLRISNPFSTERFSNYNTFYSSQDTSFLILENCNDQQLNIFNLTNHSSFSLDEKRLKCGESHNLNFVSPSHFYKLEASGDLFEFNNNQCKLIESFTQNPQLVHLGLWPGGLLNYSNEIKLLNDSLIMFPLDVNPDLKQKKFSKSDFGYPITGVYNLKTRQVSCEGITYPKFMFENNYGLLTELEQYYFNDYILYSFLPIPEIWRYDRKSQKLDRYVVKSTYDTIATPILKIKRSPKTKDILFQHHKTSPFYKKMIYDPIHHLYFRFYALPLSEKTEEGYYTTHIDRRYSVMVLDEAFNLLAETLLPKECCFIYFAVPLKDGLYINFGSFANTKQHGIKTLRINLVDIN